MTELLSALFGLALAWVIVSYNNQPDDDDVGHQATGIHDGLGLLT